MEKMVIKQREQLLPGKATQAFVNNKGGEIDTGINLTTLPYILVFAGVIVIAGAAFITRRRKYED